MLYLIQMCLFLLDLFSMKVQGLDRTLIDKVFAICDYYLNHSVTKHSRHIYDIYKLYSLVPQNDNFRKLVWEVRSVRARASICPSAQPGVNVPNILKEIVESQAYREDCNFLTVRLLEEDVKYDEAIKTVKRIAESGMF